MKHYPTPCRRRPIAFGWFALTFFLLSVGGGPAHIANASETSAPATHLRFSAYWSGLHAAELTLSFASQMPSTPVQRRHRFQLETQGLVDFFTKLRLMAASDEVPQPNHPADTAATDTYRVDYTSRRRERTVVVRYDRKAGTASAQIHTKNEPAQKDRRNEAKVGPKFRHQTIDPIRAFITILASVKTFASNDNGVGKTASTFTLPVYDGRRRFDVTGTYMGIVTRQFLTGPAPAHKLRLIPRPIAGFKDSHIKLWNRYAFDLYVSTDGQFLPLQIDALGPGPIIHLVEVCDRPCALPKQQRLP